jgi:xanthine dehydrogenase accessory factor
MKELSQILLAYQNAKDENLAVALATVVMVNGSAYRRPGARMLITQNGNYTGAISGGCLEGDALKKAQLVIFNQKSMVVTYDTTDEDDQKFGIGLGCNGIIQILMEPILIHDSNNPIELLIKAIQQPNEYFLTTFFSLKNALDSQIGTRLCNFKHEFQPAVESPYNDLFLHSLPIHEGVESIKRATVTLSEDSFVFIEKFQQPYKVVIFGAGNDVIPLVKILRVMGLPIVLIDGRENLANAERFPEVNQIIVSSAEMVFDQLNVEQQDLVLLMTHNFEYEVKVLERLLEVHPRYIGILGPKKKTLKLLNRLNLPQTDDFIKAHHIYAPIGLDLGAESSEEIALSICSEILAVFNKKSPSFLRDKIGPIHQY